MLPVQCAVLLDLPAAIGYSAQAPARTVPVPAKSPDQSDAGREAARIDIDCRDTRGQCGVFRRYNLKIRNEAAPVAVVRLIERSLGRSDGRGLAEVFALQLPKRGEVVFHFLKRRQHAGAIVCDLLVISRDDGGRLGLAQTAVEKREHALGTDRPKATWGEHPVGECKALRSRRA